MQVDRWLETAIAVLVVIVVLTGAATIFWLLADAVWSSAQ